MATALAAGLLTGCPSEKEAAPAAQKTAAQPVAPPAKTKLVVYCGRSEGLVGSTLEAFAKAHPELELDVRYNDTPALASQIVAEIEQSPADVLWFQDSGYLGALGEKGMLETLPKPLSEKVQPAFRDGNERWVGITGRLRTLVYNTEKLKPADLPKKLEDLGNPKWKGKLGWAPTNASFQAHVSALRKLWGEEKTNAWLKKMKANAPSAYPKNSPQVEAASSGEIQIGWVNHYYLHKLGKPNVKNYSFPENADAGNVMMVAGAAIRKGAANPAVAKLLIEFLLDPAQQARFAQDTYEYPAVAGVPTHPEVTPLSEVSLAPLQQEQLADIEPTLAMLRELGLL